MWWTKLAIRQLFTARKIHTIVSYRILVQLIIEDVVACFVEHSVHVFDRLSDEYNFLSFPLSRPNFPTSTLLRIQTPALSSTSLRWKMASKSSSKKLSNSPCVITQYSLMVLLLHFTSCFNFYLRQRGCAIGGFCLSLCRSVRRSVSTITAKVISKVMLWLVLPIGRTD